MTLIWLCLHKCMMLFEVNLMDSWSNNTINNQMYCKKTLHIDCMNALSYIVSLTINSPGCLNSATCNTTWRSDNICRVSWEETLSLHPVTHMAEQPLPLQLKSFHKHNIIYHGDRYSLHFKFESNRCRPYTSPFTVTLAGSPNLFLIISRAVLSSSYRNI